jgi:hypothetical protein
MLPNVTLTVIIMIQLLRSNTLLDVSGYNKGCHPRVLSCHQVYVSSACQEGACTETSIITMATNDERLHAGLYLVLLVRGLRFHDLISPADTG